MDVWREAEGRESIGLERSQTSVVRGRGMKAQWHIFQVLERLRAAFGLDQHGFN